MGRGEQVEVRQPEWQVSLPQGTSHRVIARGYVNCLPWRRRWPRRRPNARVEEGRLQFPRKSRRPSMIVGPIESLVPSLGAVWRWWMEGEGEEEEEKEEEG